MMQNLTLSLDPQSVDYIFNLIRARPHGEVEGLVTEIRRQIAEQQAPLPITPTPSRNDEAPQGAAGLQ